MRGLWSVWVLVLLALVATQGGSQEAPGDAGNTPAKLPPVLYLHPPSQDAQAGNFSTTPSASPSGSLVAPANNDPVASQVSWYWFLDQVPEAATIPAGTNVEVVAYFASLGAVVPAFDVNTAGQLVVSAELTIGGLTNTFGQGSASIEATPGATADQVEAFTIGFQTDSAAQLVPRTPGPADPPAFALVLTMHATASNSAPPYALVAGNDAQARLTLPGFPVAAFRAWEDAEAAALRCNERVLEQLPCEESNDQTPASDSARRPPLGGAPGIGFMVLIGAMSAGAYVAATRLRV